MPASPTSCKTIELAPRDYARGCIEAVESDGEWTFRRFLPGQAQKYIDAGRADLHRKTFATAGVRLAFRTDAESLAFGYRFAYGSLRKFGHFDVCVDGALVAHAGLDIDDQTRHEFSADLGPGAKNVEIYLPWSRQAFISPISLSGATFATPLRRPRRMFCFGDSITQGYDAQYPSLAYTEAVARHLGADLVNKAIGGDRFFPALLDEPDPEPPDFVLVAYGTNDWSLCQPDDVRARAAAFYGRLATLYPAARVFAVAPIWRGDPPSRSPFGEDVRCIGRLIREVCADIPGALAIPGFNLVPRLPEFFSDRHIHPNDTGFGIFAQNLLREITSSLESQR